jgi:alkaline phosphatase D
VTLSGDSHNAWAYDLQNDGRAAGVEFAGHAVSSMGLEKRFTGDPARIAADFARTNASLRWCDTTRRGYMLVELTPAAARCDWLFLPSLNTRSTAMLDRTSFTAAPGAKRLEPS